MVGAEISVCAWGRVGRSNLLFEKVFAGALLFRTIDENSWDYGLGHWTSMRLALCVRRSIPLLAVSIPSQVHCFNNGTLFDDSTEKTMRLSRGDKLF